MKYDLFVQQGDLAGAAAVATAFQAAFPQDALGYVWLGRAYVAQRKPDAALKQFDDAAKLAPGNVEALVSSVAMLTADRRGREALERIERFRAAQPKSPLPDQLLAEQALARGDLAEAQQRFAAIADLPSATAATYKNLAFVLAQRKEADLAIKTLEKGEAALPKDTSLPLARAEWLARFGRSDEAIVAYEALLKRTPSDDQLANNLAFVLSEVKGGAAALDRALAVAQRFESSQVPGYLDTLAMVHYRRGSYDNAVALLQKATQLEPKEPMLKLHLGMATVRQGDAERGKELIRQAMQTKVQMQGLDEARRLLAEG
jgi:tetratricopeptide (TPR) repeat protein